MIEGKPRLARPYEPKSDAELLNLCIENDETAWRELVVRYEALVYSAALRVGLTGDDAGDVFQEVWAELHRSLLRIRNPDSLVRWLLVATRRRSWKIAARNRRASPDMPPDLVDPWALPDEEVESMDARGRIELALEELGSPCSTLIRLLFLEHPPRRYRDIATKVGMAIGAIGAARSRCMSKLRRVLGRKS